MRRVTIGPPAIFILALFVSNALCADLQVRNGDIFSQDDRGSKAGSPSLRIVGTRNGSFSGKVLVAGGSLAGLEGRATELKGKSGTIPVDRIRVRYAVPWTSKHPAGLDILLEKPTPEMSGQIAVWVTVDVPSETAAGAYTGTLSLSAGGSKSDVPVELQVADWTLPDPQNYRTWVELIQSPDTLSMEYKTPLWSEKHWELIAKSLGYLKGIGSRILYTPLIAQCNAGNAESMVRWVNKGENKYEYDFSILDKYLDLAEKNMGRPKIVCFNVWDRSLTRPGSGGRGFQIETGLKVAAAGPLVTMVDPASGKTQNVFFPDYPFRENITVVRERLREAITVEAYAQNSLESMRKLLTDFAEDGKGSTTLNGQEARWAVFSCSRGPFRTKALMYMLVQPGQAMVITGVSRPEKFEKYKESFEETAKSFKLEDKDFSITFPKDWENLKSAELKGLPGLAAAAWGPKDGPTDPNPVRDAWKLLFDQLRERLKKRGLESAMMLGMVSDFWATKEQVEFLKEVSGNLPWVNAGHYSRKNLYDGVAGFGYQTSYFSPRIFGCFSNDRMRGWKSPELLTFFTRNNFDQYPFLNWRLIPEQCITGTVRGVGRLGADTWPAVKGKGGKGMARAWARFPAGDWGYLNCDSTTLAPGPDGPVATARFELLREGVQECEAIILIEESVVDAKCKAQLGPVLAKQVEEVLNERCEVLKKTCSPNDRERIPVIKSSNYDWFLGSGWQDRSHKLFTVAGEVQKKLGDK